jgi:phosphopantothenoylcysteine decarboxylase
MAKILLGVTGSVAAIRTPALYEALVSAGHQVRIAATRASLYFFNASSIDRESHAEPVSTSGQILFRDQDEWPGDHYRVGAEVLHIELRKWADMLVVAPLDANTLAKFALGISDNLLSCVYRAWEREKPIILAPAMNTRMWESPVTLRHLRQIVADQTDEPITPDFTLESLPGPISPALARLILIPPQSKRLACGDIGTGAMAEVETIASLVQDWVATPTS